MVLRKLCEPGLELGTPKRNGAVHEAIGTDSSINLILNSQVTNKWKKSNEGPFSTYLILI